MTKSDWKGIDLKELRLPGERGFTFLSKMLRKNGDPLSIPLWFRKNPAWWSLLREANHCEDVYGFFHEVLSKWDGWELLSDGMSKVNPSDGTEKFECFRTWIDDELDGMNAKWLWKGWIASKVFTMIMGCKGTGKSYLSLSILGKMLRGEEMPDGQYASRELVNKKVLWIDNERSQAYNTERARKMGLPLEKFVYPTDEPCVLQFEREEDRDIAEEAAECDGVGIVIIDSFSGCHGWPENHSDVGKISAWMSDLAQNTGKAVIALHHFRKPGRDNAKVGEFTMDDVRGHGSIIRTARVLLAVDIPDIENKESRRLRHLGGNISKAEPPIGFTIGDSGVEFCEAPAARVEETQLDRAVDFLRAMISKKPLPATVLFDEALEIGISKGTMIKAKVRLKIQPKRMNNRWMWGLTNTKGGDIDEE